MTAHTDHWAWREKILPAEAPSRKVRQTPLRKLFPGTPLVEFQAWLDASEPGQEHVYFTGLNLGDCENEDTCSAAKAGYAAGLVELCQRRRSDGRLDYLCIRRREITPRTVLGVPWPSTLPVTRCFVSTMAPKDLTPYFRVPRNP